MAKKEKKNVEALDDKDMDKVSGGTWNSFGYQKPIDPAHNSSLHQKWFNTGRFPKISSKDFN